MNYYFYITFKKGGNLGGHNCTKFELKDDYLILEGYDELNYTSGYERENWRSKYELSEIKEIKFEVMEDEEEEFWREFIKKQEIMKRLEGEWIYV